MNTRNIARGVACGVAVLAVAFFATWFAFTSMVVASDARARADVYMCQEVAVATTLTIVDHDEEMAKCAVLRP
jgi:hypothetical protein